MRECPSIDDLAGCERFLAEHLPWTAREFVPGISKSGDRKVVAAELCRALPASDDFRFIWESGGEDVVVLAERLPWDSEFFGEGIAKLHGVWSRQAPLNRVGLDYRSAVEVFLARCRRHDVRYLFAPVDPRDLTLFRALGELGFVLIETKYFHHGPVAAPVFENRQPVRRATESDLPSLVRTAVDAINPYDRFHADPFFSKADVARLMAKWIEESVRGRMADVVIVPDVAEPTAFVTYRYHRDRWNVWNKRLAQGVLSAVSPEFSGWMGRVNPEILHHLAGIGVEHVFGSTQVTNQAIIHFAQSEGARFGRCEHTFRIVLA